MIPSKPSPPEIINQRMTILSCVARFLTLTALLPAFCSVAVRGQGIEAAKPAESPGAPFTLTIALKESKITVGEPIVLRYELRQVGGNLNQSIPLDQRVPWLKVRLLNATGKEVSSAALTSVQGTETNRVRLSGYFTEFSARSWKDEIVFGDKRLPVPAPGVYRIVVEASDLVSPFDDHLIHSEQGYGSRGGSLARIAPLPALFGRREDKPPVRIYGGSRERAATLPTVRHALRGVWSFPLIVRPDKGTVFHKVQAARQLLQKGDAGYPGSLQNLFSLYGPAAQREQHASVDDLLTNPDRYESPFLVETATLGAVAALGTPEALDFVLGEYWARHQTHIVRPGMPGNALSRAAAPRYPDSGVGQVLARLYASGDPALRSMIEVAFDAHHQPIPTIISDSN